MITIGTLSSAKRKSGALKQRGKGENYGEKEIKRRRMRENEERKRGIKGREVVVQYIMYNLHAELCKFYHQWEKGKKKNHAESTYGGGVGELLI